MRGPSGQYKRLPRSCRPLNAPVTRGRPSLNQVLLVGVQVQRLPLCILKIRLYQPTPEVGGMRLAHYDGIFALSRFWKDSLEVSGSHFVGTNYGPVSSNFVVRRTLEKIRKHRSDLPRRSEWKYYTSGNGTVSVVFIKPRTIEVIYSLFIVLRLCERISLLIRKFYSTLASFESRKAIVVLLNKVAQGIEVPVLHLEYPDPDFGIEEHEIRSQPVQVRLDVYLPG